MDFRVARPDELKQIASLYHRIWHETQAPHQHPDIAKFRDVRFMQDRINAFYPNIIIALDELDIVGLVVAKEARLSQLFVDRQQRGKGVGQKLLALAEAKLRAEGAVRITLNCLVGNDAARRFYERNDWRVSRMETKMGQTHKGEVPIEVFEMERTLDVLDHFA